MILSQTISFFANLPFFRKIIAKRTSKKALSLFDEAKIKLEQSTLIAEQVIYDDGVKIAKLQAEIDEMSKLAETNTTITNNININILGKTN